MKKYVLLSCFLVLLIACDADDQVHTDIPSVVLNAFHREFPEAVEEEWQQRDSLYEVDFEIASQDHSALINSKGGIPGKKQELGLNEVPAQVISGLTRNFKRSDLEDPELVKWEDKTYYQLELDKFLFDERIVLDETGKIITNFPYWE